MPSDVSNLDLDYVELLKARNELIKQLNVSLQVQINEAQGRVQMANGSVLDTSTPTTQVPPPPPPPIDTQPVESQKDSSTNASDDKSSENVEKATKTDKSDDKGSGEKKRFRMLVNKWNSEDKKWEDIEYEPANKLERSEENSHVTYRRHTAIDNERHCYHEECEIPVQGLKTLLQDEMSHIYKEYFESDSVAYGSPFTNIVHNWDALEKATQPQDGDDRDRKDARGDLKVLLDNIRISEPYKLSLYFKERDSQLRAKAVTFSTLWTLFQPGTRVLAKPFMDEWQMFEVQLSFYVNPPNMPDPDPSAGFERFRFFHLFCAGFDWDGRHFRRYTYRFVFEKFEGRRLISALQCFPIKFWPSDGPETFDALKGRLIERGKKFTRLCTASKEDFLCNYDGFLLYGLPPRPPRESTPRVAKRELKKQSVIVDNKTYMESRRNIINEYFSCPPLGPDAWQESLECCPCPDCRASSLQTWSGNYSEDPEKERDAFAKENDRLLLCPPKVLGYVPMERLWAQFSVDHLEKIQEEQKKKDKACFSDKLELDEGHKEMLLALIKSHESRKSKSKGLTTSTLVQDPIEGKGRGLAILLHGPPGVGKTLTAEAVALATAKPLLFVSVAELGMEPDTVEEKLQDMFADASRWDAVMVIDEADVFLEERIGTTDVSRNALVSVLLRVLEYYDGIIILTTNRITSLDIAVQSRMHLAIQYNDLTPDQKKNIFLKFLSDVPADKIESRDSIIERLEFKRMDLNGRQIRNIVSGAQALANSEGTILSYGHISRVYEATSDFMGSLKDLNLKKRGRNEAAH